MSDDDLIARLGRELGEAAERQAAGRRGLLGGLGRRRAEAGGEDPSDDARGPVAWLRRRSGRTLLLAGGVTMALAGVGGAAGLLAGRGAVGGPATLTYARLAPEQRAAGLRETTRPVVIGRGRGRHSGWAWQLVAFQTTSGLCIAIDFPAIENIGGGCAVDVPREGRPIDWQGYLDRLGSRGPSTLLGAVAPAAARVTLAHGYGDRRIAEEAHVVRVRDRQILDAIGVKDPFALWIGEVTEANPMARAVAYDAAGAELGAVGVPNGGAGSGGFLPQGCELPRPGEQPLQQTTIALPQPIAGAYGAFRRPQRASDRPAWLVRRLLGEEQRRDGRFSTPFMAGFVGSIDLGALRRAGTAPDGRALFLVVTKVGRHGLPDGCLRTTTPRLRREQERQARALDRSARIPQVTLVDARLRTWGEVRPEAPHGGVIGYGGGRQSEPTRVFGVVSDEVATAELSFRGGVRRTVRIRGNLLWTTVPMRPGRIRIDRQVLRDRDGKIVAVVRRGG